MLIRIVSKLMKIASMINTAFKQDLYFIDEALAQAQIAATNDEVPIGAVLVIDNKIITKASNSVISMCDPSAHAEILVLRQAGALIKNYRLLNSTLYVTIEPCAMCLMAMIHARVARLVFAAHEPKTGVITSTIDLQAIHSWNHKIVVESGVNKEPAVKLMQDFFKNKRVAKK
jgi:tRNA(adenine34) deaminase